MNVLIVDDEPLARSRLVRLLEQNPDCDSLSEAGNGEQAIIACQQQLPDVVLMDIRMPVMDGIQAARHLSTFAEPPAVIFCTAYNDYALDAFDANAVDYLLKPVNRERLSQALAKAKKLNRAQLLSLSEQHEPTADSQHDAPRAHIAAKSSRGIELVAIENIRYFMADQKYVTVFYQVDGEQKQVLIDDSLKDLEQELGDQFVRIHRNALAAVTHIRGLEKSVQAVYLKLSGIEQGPQVSRRYQSAVRDLLQHL